MTHNICKIVIIAASWLSSVVGFSDDLKNISINLCLNETRPKNQELFKNLLELQLLLIEDFETGDCDSTWPNKPYLFRQQVNEITKDGEDEKRIQAISALYHPDGRVILSQMELIERASRKTMNDRAKQLAHTIKKAIAANDYAVDPFNLNRKEASDKGPRVPSLLPIDTLTEAKESPIATLGLFAGMERSFETHKEAGISKEHVVSKPFMVVGANISSRVGVLPLIARSHVRGAFTKLELLRPFMGVKSHKAFKMLNFSTQLLWHMEMTSYFSLNLGLIVDGSYVNSDINERVPGARLYRYWQFKEGLVFDATIFLAAFDTSLCLHTAYFPFVQNLSLPSKVPFVNFGWQLGIDAESTLYRSFGLRFSLSQRSDHFDVTSTFNVMRVVSFGSLAYLGVVMRI